MSDLSDELLSLKSLLDAGILTKEEFDAKKQQLLFSDTPTESRNPFVIEDGVLVSYTGSAAIVEIPDGVRVIGQECFAYRQEIREVRFPEGSLATTEIGNGAFKGCENLKFIYDQEDPWGDIQVAKIGDSAFEGCPLFEGGPDELTLICTHYIGSKAVKGCLKARIAFDLDMDVPLVVESDAFEGGPEPGAIGVNWKSEWETRKWDGWVKWRPRKTNYANGLSDTCVFVRGVKGNLQECLCLAKFMPDCVVTKFHYLAIRSNAELELKRSFNKQVAATVSTAVNNDLCPVCKKGRMVRDASGDKVLSAKKAAAGAVLAGPAGAVVGAAMGLKNNRYVCDKCGHVEMGTANRGGVTGFSGLNDFGLYDLKTWEEYRAHEKDVLEKAENARKKAEEEDEQCYTTAKEFVSRGDRDSLEDAAALFESLGDYRDSAELRKDALCGLAALLAESNDPTDLNKAKKYAESLGDFKNAEILVAKASSTIAEMEAAKKAKTRKIAMIVGAAIAVVAIVVAVVMLVVIPSQKASHAHQLISEGKYDEAQTAIAELSMNDEAKSMLCEIAQGYIAQGDIAKAYDALKPISDYPAAKAVLDDMILMPSLIKVRASGSFGIYYNDAGHMTKYGDMTIDCDSQGQMVRWTDASGNSRTFAYNSDGTISMESNDGASGKYDAAGHLLDFEHSRASMTSTGKWTTDTNGNAVEELTSFSNLGRNGSQKVHYTNHFDDEGKLVTIDFQQNNQPPIADYWVIEYTPLYSQECDTKIAMVNLRILAGI